MGRTRPFAVAAATAIAWLVAAPPAETAQWLRLRSAHFVVVGDASEGELRQVAVRVEGFRAALMRALPNATVAMPVPMTIIVFATEAGFTPFKPLVTGRPMERVAGYFLPGEDGHLIAMTVAQGDAAYSTVLHEYTHALLAETLPAAPLWLHEGLAEVYGSYTERADGRSALIGAAPAMHLRELRTGSPLPIEELLSADVQSALYNEGARRGMFYAQAWALTHYLLLQNQTRRAQVPEFLRLRTEGNSVADAIRGAFACEPEVLERELRDHGRLFVLNGVEVALDPDLRRRATLTTERITPAEATAYAVELLARLGRPDEARTAIEGVLRLHPDQPRALAALGRLHLRDGRVADALLLLRRAADAMPGDSAVASALARTLVEQLRARGRNAAAEDREGLDRVGRALDTAAALDPDDAYVTAMQGYVALLEGGDLERARERLARAVSLSPARQEYHLLLGQVLLEQRDLPAAQALLGPLLAHGAGPEIRDRARTLLARAVNDSGATAAVTQAVQQAWHLRTVAPDETRILGDFERVECGPAGTFLHIRTDGGPLKLRVALLDNLDFINYRDDPVAPLGCAGFPEPLRVVATYRSGVGSADPEGVAIEIVPAAFTLP